MSRAVSSTLKAEAYSLNSDEVYIMLITIDHSTLSSPIRITPEPLIDIGSGFRGVVSNGNGFIALPVEVSLPTEEASKMSSARIKIDNISREIVQAARGMQSPADVMIEIVLASGPDTVEATYSDFKLRGVTYDAYTVEGELTVELYEFEPFPAGRMTPARFPGLF